MASFRSIASVTALLSGGRLAGVGMTFFTQLILARQLAPEELGLFFLSSGIATALSVFTSLGYPNLAARILARSRGGRGRDRRDAFLLQARREMAVASLLAMIVTLGIAVAVWDVRHAVVIGLGLLAVPPLAQIRLLSQIGNAERRMVLAYLPELVVRPAGLLAAVALAAVAGWPLDATGLILVFVALALVVLVWMQLGLDRPGSRPKPPKPPKRMASAWRRSATPLILVTLFTAAFADASVAVAGFFLGLADLAVFTLALKIAWLGGYAIQTIHQAVLADMADAVQGRRADRVAHSLVVANRLGLALSVGFVAVCWLGGDLLLSIFGPDYAAGGAILTVLAASHAVRAAAGPSVQILSVSQYSRLLGTLSIVCTLVLVASMWAFTLLAGPPGAAWAVTFAMSLWSIASAWLVWTRIGARCDVFASLLPRRMLARAAHEEAQAGPV